MAEMMEKQIDETQRPTYAAILKRASPRTTQSQITTAAVKRVASGGENEPSVIKSVTTFANIERKNGREVKTVSKTQNETDTQQENGWETVPGNFSPIPRTSFVRSIPMIYPVRPQNIVQKSLNRMKAPKSKFCQSVSMASEGGTVSLQEIRIDVTPFIDDTNPENSHVKNTESFGTLFKNKVVKKLKSVKKIYRKWSKTETDVLPKYMPTEEIEGNSPRSVARKRQIGSRVLFAIGFILLAVFGAIFLIQMLQRDYQGSRHLMAKTEIQTFDKVSRYFLKGTSNNEEGTFTIKGDTVEFKKNGKKGSIKWKRDPEIPCTLSVYSSGLNEMKCFKKGRKKSSLGFFTNGNGKNFGAALETKFVTNSWYVTRYSNRGKKRSGRFELNENTLTFYKNSGKDIATWTRGTGEVSSSDENGVYTISGFKREGEKNDKICIEATNEGRSFIADLTRCFNRSTCPGGDADGDRAGVGNDDGDVDDTAKDKGMVKTFAEEAAEAVKAKRKKSTSTGSTEQSQG